MQLLNPTLNCYKIQYKKKLRGFLIWYHPRNSDRLLNQKQLLFRSGSLLDDEVPSEQRLSLLFHMQPLPREPKKGAPSLRGRDPRHLRKSLNRTPCLFAPVSEDRGTGNGLWKEIMKSSVLLVCSWREQKVARQRAAGEIESRDGQ